jgi:hypothetical protein
MANKTETTNMDPTLALELKLSSWKNLFRVLKWAGLGKLRPGQYRTHEEQEGFQYTTGNFWAAVQSLEAQIDLHESVQAIAGGDYGPLADGHPLVGHLCPLCGLQFAAGECTAPLPIAPADDREAEKFRRGEPYKAACDIVHAICLERRKAGVRFVQGPA